tara:strand:+ start:472 stop:912 length:441 start_codon:yes stop_codon:yes gene_type:complete
MSFNIDKMENNILHAIAVAKEKHKIEEDFSFINGLPTNEEEYKENIRWLNGEDKDGNQLYHSDQKLTWKQVQDVVAEASARNKLHDLRKERNSILSQSDWIVVKEREEGGSVSNFADWKEYRQKLRDITNTYKSLDEVKWPTAPSE